MAITPVDILHTQFKTAYRGYNKAQVDQFLRSVTQALEDALREKNDLQRKIDALQDEVDRMRKIESAMTEALTLAQRTAEDVKTHAHRQAEMIVAEAEQARVKMTVEAQREAEKYRAEIALLQASRDRFESELRALLQGHLDWLDKRGSSDEAQAEVA